MLNWLRLWDSGAFHGVYSLSYRNENLTKVICFVNFSVMQSCGENNEISSGNFVCIDKPISWSYLYSQGPLLYTLNALAKCNLE